MKNKEKETTVKSWLMNSFVSYNRALEWLNEMEKTYTVIDTKIILCGATKWVVFMRVE